MRKIIIPIILSFVFAGELEVDGNLTVTGGIDSPTIDALRDDGEYEYIIFFVHVSISNGQVYHTGYLRLDIDNFNENDNVSDMTVFNSELTTLFNDGWKLDSINGDTSSWWILKRPIEE